MEVGAGSFEPQAHSRLAERLEAWIERGWLAHTPEGQLEVRVEAWHGLASQLGEPGAADDDELRDQVEYLDRQAGVTRPALAIGVAGHLGGPRRTWTLAAEGVSVPLSPPTPWPGGHVLDPIGFAILETLARANEGPRTLDADLETLLELRRLAALPTAPEVAFSEHLAARSVERIDKVRLAWEPSADGRTFSLGIKARIRESIDRLLKATELKRGQRAVQLDKKAHAILSPDVERLVRGSAAHQHRTLKEASAALLDSSLVVPEDVDPAAVDLSEYSARVLGFEPWLSRAFSIEQSGIDWDEVADDGGAFLRVRFAGAEARPLELSVEGAAELRDRLADELARPEPGLVPLGRHHVPPLPDLKEQLDRALAIRARSLEEEATAGASPATPKVEAAIIAEAASDDDLGAERVPAPWAELSRLLQPGVQLKTHQRRGLDWLWSHRSRAADDGRPGGVLLADDMGCGKTLQVLCLLALARARARAAGDPRPNLLVLPKTLRDNWRAEIERFFQPGAFGELHELDGRAGAARFAERASGADGLALVTYNTFALSQRELLAVPFEVAVFDEAQNLKNPDTLQSRAARGTRFRFAVAMTGTPVENGLPDLWTLLDVATHGRFGTRLEFEQSYLSTEGGVEALRRRLAYRPAKAVVKSPVLRRTKADLSEDLPKKVVHAHPLPMTDRQVELERVVWQDARGGKGRVQLAVLQELDRLYQHPALLADEDPSIPLERLEAESPKLARCLALLDDVRARGEKALVFTRAVRMQDLLCRAIERRTGLARVDVLNGDTNRRKGRVGEILARFGRAPGFDALVLSPVAAGVGLNIAAANHVIHYGRWWNPAKEDQATDRAYRIGQTKDVHVHYLILHRPGDPTRGFDARLHELIERKRGLARDLFHPSADLELGLDDLATLDDDLEEGEAGGAG